MHWQASRPHRQYSAIRDWNAPLDEDRRREQGPTRSWSFYRFATRTAMGRLLRALSSPVCCHTSASSTGFCTSRQKTIGIVCFLCRRLLASMAEAIAKRTFEGLKNNLTDHDCSDSVWISGRGFSMRFAWTRKRYARNKDAASVGTLRGPPPTTASI